MKITRTKKQIDAAKMRQKIANNGDRKSTRLNSSHTS